MCYGACPKCGLPGIVRERRIDGNDTCLNGHTYPSKSALLKVPDLDADLEGYRGELFELRAKNKNLQDSLEFAWGDHRQRRRGRLDPRNKRVAGSRCLLAGHALSPIDPQTHLALPPLQTGRGHGGEALRMHYQPESVGGGDNVKPTRALLDMDGVLVDFVAGVFRHRGLPRVPVQWDFVTPSEWESFGFDFWANLELTPEAGEILRATITAFGLGNICILSSPCKTAGCMEGKLAWLRKHLPSFSRRFLFGPAKEFCAGADTVLIDDSDANVNKFGLAGGHTILVPREWNARRREQPLTAVQEILNLG